MRPTQPPPDFDIRPHGGPIVFAQSSKGHASKKIGIEEGDTVTLKLGIVSVIVIDIEAIGAGRYKGIIDGFEMHPGIDYKGYRIGETVEFSAQQVFAAQTP